MIYFGRGNVSIIFFSLLALCNLPVLFHDQFIKFKKISIYHKIYKHIISYLYISFLISCIISPTSFFYRFWSIWSAILEKKCEINVFCCDFDDVVCPIHISSQLDIIFMLSHLDVSWSIWVIFSLFFWQSC